MKHLGISGGATKISSLTGACEALILEKKYKPDIVSAISAGSVIALPIILGKWADIIESTTNFNLDSIFSIKPINEKGSITSTAIRRAISGQPALGEQYNLVKSIREVISVNDFNEYKDNDKYPPIYVGAVDFRNTERVFYNLKDLSFIEYFKIVLASCSMPVFTPPVSYDDKVLFDGGVVNHVATPWMLKHFSDITETVSIYARPEINDQKSPDWEAKNILNVIFRYITVNGAGVSKANEELEDYICEVNDIKQYKIFIPIYMDNLFDVDRNNILNLYHLGKLAVEKYFKD
jgi:predicted acylesterase/phospholipase RssA